MYEISKVFSTIEIIISNLHTINVTTKNYRRFLFLTEKYQCAICGHEYNPEMGEPLQNIPRAGNLRLLQKTGPVLSAGQQRNSLTGVEPDRYGLT